MKLKILLSIITTLSVLAAPCKPDKAPAHTYKNSPVLLTGHKTGISSIRFTPDNRWLVSTGLDHTVRIYSTDTWLEASVLTAHENEVFTVAFSSDSRYMATSDFDGKVLIWDFQKREQIRSISLEHYSISLDISSDGVLAIGTNNAEVKLLDIETNESLGIIDTSYPVNILQFINGGSELVTAGPLSIWNTKTLELIERPRTVGGIYGLAISKDGERVASSHAIGRAQIYTKAENKITHYLRVKKPGKTVYEGGYKNVPTIVALSSVAFVNNDNQLVTGGADGKVRLHDIATSEIISEIGSHERSVTSLAVSQNGKYLASAGMDATIQVWEVKSLNP